MHVLGEALKIDGKIDMTHIPYKGAAPLKQELLAGRIQIGGDQLSTSLAEVRKGDLIALATCSPKRIAALPNVPTVRELGYARLEFDGWNGLFVAAKTPRAMARATTLAATMPSSVRPTCGSTGFSPVAAANSTSPSSGACTG